MKREQAEQIAQAAMDRFMGKGGFRIKPWVIDAIMEAVAVEREECAKVCEGIQRECGEFPETASNCAEAIRARGER